MHPNLILIGLFVLQLVTASPAAVALNSGITTNNNKAQINFPDAITFSIDLQSDANIKDAVLEYGVDELTCGKLVAKGFADFKPAKSVKAEWTWEMKQSGSLPTGSKIWWRWNITDEAGKNQVTDTQTITWIDSIHPWKTLSSSSINLHWYQGDNAYGTDLLKNADSSIVALDKQIGLKPDGKVDLYIYASADDMNKTVFYQPDWTGGIAFPEYNIVLIGIPADEMVWGRHTETHELTHVLVGHLAFSCLGSVPNWLNEGLAMYSEGNWDTNSQAQLKYAIGKDQVFSVRSLASAFPEDADKAGLAYVQSQSIVAFLVEKFSQDKMTTLLKTLRDGTSIDPALQKVYGFDQDGLEDAWRANVGAPPRTAAKTAPTPETSPTPVPTIVPISGVPVDATSGPSGEPTSAAASLSTPTPAPGSTYISTPQVMHDLIDPQPYINIAGIICGGLTCLLLIVVIVSVILWSRRQQQKRNNL
jgi:hypothetical protein